MTTLKQDLAVILLSTGIGVFIGLGLGAQSDKRIVFPAPHCCNVKITQR